MKIETLFIGVDGKATTTRTNIHSIYETIFQK